MQHELPRGQRLVSPRQWRVTPLDDLRHNCRQPGSRLRRPSPRVGAFSGRPRCQFAAPRRCPELFDYARGAGEEGLVAALLTRAAGDTSPSAQRWVPPDANWMPLSGHLLSPPVLCCPVRKHELAYDLASSSVIGTEVASISTQSGSGMPRATRRAVSSQPSRASMKCRPR
jgi:hypothetical protein